MDLHFSCRKFGLLDLLLLIAVAGAWFADRKLNDGIASMRFSLESAIGINPELRILNEDRLVATKRTPEHFGQRVFDLAVPSSGDFSLCIAVGQVGFELDNVTGPTKCAHLPSGRHTIEIVSYEVALNFLIEIWLDEALFLSCEATNAKLNHFIESGQVLESVTANTELENGKPLVLHRYIFASRPPMANFETHSLPVPDDNIGVLVWCQ